MESIAQLLVVSHLLLTLAVLIWCTVAQAQQHRRQERLLNLVLTLRAAHERAAFLTTRERALFPQEAALQSALMPEDSPDSFYGGNAAMSGSSAALSGLTDPLLDEVDPGRVI